MNGFFKFFTIFSKKKQKWTAAQFCFFYWYLFFL
jgi:hypothetical protein